MAKTNQFHSNHSQNKIILEEEGKVAHWRTDRRSSTLLFSKWTLSPGEIFVIEVEEMEKTLMAVLRLFRNLRLGLTQMNPGEYGGEEDDLFQLAFSDLIWMYDVQKLRQRGNVVNIPDNYIRTSYGNYSIEPLVSTDPFEDSYVDLRVGFKFGVFYIPHNEKVADIYYVVNDTVLGPAASIRNYKKRPIYAAMLSPSHTKTIRVLPLKCERTLKQICRSTIFETHDMKKVMNMALPKTILKFLAYDPQESSLFKKKF